MTEVGGPPAAGPPSRGEILWYKFAWNLLFPPFRLLWHPVTRGRENLPASGPYILAPVHRSYVDTLLAAYLTRRRLRFMAKEEIFSKPWSRKLFTSLGGLPVRRGAPDRVALRLCEQILANGEPVVLFPEGTRRSGPVVEEIFGGAAFVALRAGVPVVPVGIAGSEKAMPAGAKMVRPARIGIVIGKPIHPPDRPGSGRVARNAINDLTERIQSELQEAYDEARALLEEGGTAGG